MSARDWIEAGARAAEPEALAPPYCKCPACSSYRDRALGRASRSLLAALAAMAEKPSEEMIAASCADPASKACDAIFSIALVHGAALPPEYSAKGNTPIERWFRAMLLQARKEIGDAGATTSERDGAGLHHGLKAKGWTEPPL